MRSKPMILCSNPTCEAWMPQLSDAGIAASPWTRMRIHGIELANSLQWTEWNRNPVQVQLCDHCGTIDCSSSGYVHLSRIGGLVLWTYPQINPPASGGTLTFYPASALERLGPLAFPSATWNALAQKYNDVPHSSLLATANGRALIDAWFTTPQRRAPERLLATLRDCLMAANTLANDAAIQKATQWLDWFTTRNETPVNGRVLETAKHAARIETLYFDGPASEDWSAFAEWQGTLYPLLTAQHFFVPHSD